MKVERPINPKLASVPPAPQATRVASQACLGNESVGSKLCTGMTPSDSRRTGLWKLSVQQMALWVSCGQRGLK